MPTSHLSFHCRAHAWVARRQRQPALPKLSSLFVMTANFYRILACLGLVVGLAGCSRATYSFSSQPAYSAATVAAPTSAPDSPTALVEPATGPTPGTAIDVIGPARRPRHRAQSAHALPGIQPHLLASRKRAVGALSHRRVRSHNTAGSGPYFSGADFNAIFLLLALYALLIASLIGIAITLLVKLITHFVNQSSRKSTSPAVPGSTP